jgi:hypothetical protein
MKMTLLLVLLLAASPHKAPVDDGGIDPAVANDPDSLDALRDHIYEKTPPDLVDASRALLKERGFAPQESEDPFGFDTAWKKDPQGGQMRYHVGIFAISTEKAQAKFTLEHQGPERDPAIDLPVAWALLKKVDPEGAKALIQQAPPLAKTRPGKPLPKAKQSGSPGMSY